MATGAIEPFTGRILSRIASVLAFFHLTNILTIGGVFWKRDCSVRAAGSRFFWPLALFFGQHDDLLDGFLLPKKLSTPFWRVSGFGDGRFGDAIIFPD